MTHNDNGTYKVLLKVTLQKAYFCLQSVSVLFSKCQCSVYKVSEFSFQSASVLFTNQSDLDGKESQCLQVVNDTKFIGHWFRSCIYILGH